MRVRVVAYLHLPYPPSVWRRTFRVSKGCPTTSLVIPEAVPATNPRKLSCTTFFFGYKHTKVSIFAICCGLTSGTSDTATSSTPDMLKIAVKRREQLLQQHRHVHVLYFFFHVNETRTKKFSVQPFKIQVRACGPA